MPAKYSRTSDTGPLYVVLPLDRSNKWSKSSNVVVAGWWMEAMTKICSSNQFCVNNTHLERTLYFFAVFRTKLMTSKLAAESNPLVGSSRKSSFGLVINWLATLTLRFCPPDTPLRIGVPINVSACCCNPNDSNREFIRAIRSVFETDLSWWSALPDCAA